MIQRNNYYINRKLSSLMNPYSSLWSYMPPIEHSSSQVIPIDIRIDDNNVIVHAELPGMMPSDLSVEIDKDILRIESTVDKPTDEHHNDYIVRERRVRSAKRAIKLPHTVDPESTTSTYKNGILEINLPKLDRAQSTRITVGS